MNRSKPGERHRYERFIKGVDRYLYDMAPREMRYVVGNKFILRGNDVNMGYLTR